MAVVDLSTMDITGSDPDFLREDQRFIIYKSPQTVSFGEPVFANENLKIYRLEDNGDSTLLEAGIDYIIPAENNYATLIDTDATSQAKLQAYGSDDGFTSKLIKGVVLQTTNLTAEYQISCQYQALYKDPATYSESGTGPAYTPALMKSVIQKIDYLLSVKNPVTSIANDVVNGIKVMDEDYTGELDANHVYSEEHTVDVVNNIFVIRPANGSFYKHDLLLKAAGTEVRTVDEEDDIGKKIVVNGNYVTLTSSNITGIAGTTQRFVIESKELVEGEDYEVKGVNYGKTRVAYHQSGVYDYIILTSKIVGSVYVSYHAFGGEISIADINILKNGIVAINNILANGNFVTTENLPNQDIILSILDRLEDIEEFIRHYDMQQFPYTYYNFTYNSKEYSKEYWVDVAAVDHGPWSEDSDVPAIYTGSFKLDVEEDGYYADFEIKYNLNGNKLDITNKRITGTTYEGDGLDYFKKRIVPKFRIIYRSDDILTDTLITTADIGKKIKVGSSYVTLDYTNINNTYKNTTQKVVTSGYNRGLILQMSITCSERRTVDVRFYEKTGISGIWTLIDSAANARSDHSLTATLPGDTGDDDWISGTTGHETTNIATLYDDNYTIFVGDVPMATIDSLSYREGADEDGDGTGTEPIQVDLNGMTINSMINNLDVDMKNIKAVKFTVYDRVANKFLVEESSQVNTVDNAFSAVAIYYVNDLCGVECSVNRADTTVMVNNIAETITAYTAVVKSRSGTNSLNNERFDLRKIDLVF